MQRITLFAALAVAVLLAFGCGRSDQPTEDHPESIEPSAGDQAVKTPGSEATAPADEPKTVTVREEEKSTDGEQVPQTVEAGCAKHMFNMKGIDSCELAIMIDGKAYEVTGAYIDPVESGLCKAVKKAQVVGRVVQYGEGLTIDGQQGEFIAESIQLQE